MIRKLVAALLFLPVLAFGQINSNYQTGQVLSAASLNFNFAQAVNLAGSSMTGTLTAPTLIGVNGSLTNATIANLTVTGTATLPAGSTLPPQAANTMLGNATGSTASPTAVTMPGCNSSSSALQWTSGTGFVCGSSFANLGGATFTGALGPVTLNYANANLIVNDTSGSGYSTITFNRSGTNHWVLGNNGGASDAFFLNRYSSGSYVDTPVTISSSTGLVTFNDGISSTSSATSISGGTVNNTTIGATTASTGAFTTLSASSTVSGTGFSSYLASPPAIGGTAAAAGSFTTLSATGLVTPSATNGIKGTTAADNANAGSIGEYLSNTASSVSIATATNTNCASLSLTAGDWDVSGWIVFNPTASTTTFAQAGFSTTSAAFDATAGRYATLNTSSGSSTGAITLVPMVNRYNVSSTTTLYLVCATNFSSGTNTYSSYLRARRVR